MTSRVASLAIDAVDPVALADFWCAVLGYEVVATEDGMLSIGAPGRLDIDITPVPSPKPATKNRLHLDLRADGSSRDAELDRLLALGARHVDVGQGPDVSWVVLADPEGNEFCLLSRTWGEVQEG